MTTEEQLQVDRIRQLLKSSLDPCYENTSRTWIYCRCPFCGDSKKSKSSAHFYIAMNPPFGYHCFKCGEHGSLNDDVLNKLGIFNNELSLDILTANKSSQRTSNVSLKKEKKVIINDSGNATSTAGLSYFNLRFNSSFNLKEVNSKFKCSCDIPQFLKDNNIEVPLSGFDLSKAIGFLSKDNTYLICRDITNKQSKRYFNLKLFDSENASKIYTMHTAVDAMSKSINLVITEGVFDIIGIYNAKYKNNPDIENNTIFAAACGKTSYAAVINQIAKMFLNINVIIYSDNDVDVYFFKKLKKENIYLSSGLSMKLYYNKFPNEKDTGVAPERISLEEAVI